MHTQSNAAMPTASRVVTGTAAVSGLILKIAAQSQWFEVTPLPGDQFEIRVKAENAGLLNAATTDIEFAQPVVTYDEEGRGRFGDPQINAHVITNSEQIVIRLAKPGAPEENDSRIYLERRLDQWRCYLHPGDCDPAALAYINDDGTTEVELWDDGIQFFLGGDKSIEFTLGEPSEDALTIRALSQGLDPSRFVTADPDSWASPQDFMSGYGMDSGAGEEWKGQFPEDPAKMTFEQAQDWVNAAILADLATHGDRNWGNLNMHGNIGAYKAWHAAFTRHVKTRLQNVEFKGGGVATLNEGAVAVPPSSVT